MITDKATFLVIGLILPSLILFPIFIQNADAFKLTNYEIKLEVEFWNTDPTNPFYAAVDNGLMENIIFDAMEPIAVGQWNIEDIVADNSLSTSNFPKFHDVVIINPDSSTSLITVQTNSKLVVDPIILEINTAQGANKATVQDQIVDDTQNSLRTLLQGYGIDSFVWTLGYDGGDIIIAETP